MRQHALTHKNSERPNSPNSSNTNSDNEQASQSDRNRDSEMNDQSDDEAGANTENGNEENFGSKRVDHSPTRLNNLQSIDEEKEQRQSSLNEQDDQEDISRSQSNSSKNLYIFIQIAQNNLTLSVIKLTISCSTKIPINKNIIMPSSNQFLR